MALWTQAQGLYCRALESPIATGWRRWGKFAYAIPFAAADITISRDKYAAVGANVTDVAVAWALRKRRGALPFILPPIAYAIARPIISSITGRGEIKGGTKITQRIASEIITVGESNKPINPIKGHDAGRWGREQTFADGDFQPGASWRGLLSALRHPVRSFQAWRLGKAITKGGALYESMGRRAAAQFGIVPSAVKVRIDEPTIKELAGTIGMQVLGPKGEPLFSVARTFAPKTIFLADISVSPFLQQKGIARFMQTSELGIFHRMGYKAGTAVEATVIHPATAGMHLKYYGGKVQYAGLQESLEQELVRAGTWKPGAATFEQRILAGEYAPEQFIGGAAAGRLPSSKAVNKIIAHKMTWGRGWVHRILDTDFIPGASWRGLSKGIRRLFTRAPKADWAKVQDIVNPLVALEKEVGHRAAEFVGRAPIEKILVPEANFPVRYFGKVGAGRTLTMEAAGIQEAVPMITAPGAMKSPQLAGKLGEAYKGTAVHEIAESSYAFSTFARSKRGAKFLELYGHYSPDVMRAQGLFMEQIGLTVKEMKVMYGEIPGFRWMRQGHKYGYQKEFALKETMKRKQKLNELQAAAQPLPFKLNAKRRASHGVDRTR